MLSKSRKKELEKLAKHFAGKDIPIDLLLITVNFDNVYSVVNSIFCFYNPNTFSFKESLLKFEGDGKILESRKSILESGSIFEVATEKLLKKIMATILLNPEARFYLLSCYYGYKGGGYEVERRKF